MAASDELAFLDATAQAALVRQGEITAAELVEAALERIARDNPALNAVITPMDDLARTEAAKVDPAAPFAGVPFLLKDLVADYGGVPTASGSAFLKGRYVAKQDSELVARFRRAGLVVCGKTNTPEFGLLPTTEPAAFGASRNPWDLKRTTGGSSGGSAAAVAAGLVPAAHANDGGGSIRIPAACCGLFGLKPTRARNPMGPELGDAGGGLAVEHVVTRSVRDSAALLDATSGPDIGDPYWAPPPERPFAQECGRDPGQLRIALSFASLSGATVADDCREAVLATARLCEELGHVVEEATPALAPQPTIKAFGRAWTAFASWAIKGWAATIGREPTEADFEPLTWQMFQSGERVSAGNYLLAMQELQKAGRTFARFLTGYDVWLTPVVARPPVPLGYFDPAGVSREEFLTRIGEYSGFTNIANASGNPAMSVPLHWTADGLPVGVQFTGRFGDEATLFRLAAQLEQARPWGQRRPPVAAAAA